MSTTEHQQAFRTAWINAMRAEVLRVGKRLPEVARVAHVGVWIATYADADGSNSFPGRDTLAVLAGCSEETVTRCVKVLMGVGALARKRRPNTSSMYQLLPTVLLPGGLLWEEHLHHYTDTRQRKAHAKKKAEGAANVIRTASMDAVREEGGKPDRVHGCGPDSVHGGGSGKAPRNPDSVHGRPRKASTDAVRTASMAGVDKVFRTSGTDPRTDKERVAPSPQPQVRAGARGEGDFPQQQDEAGTGARPGGSGAAESLRLCRCGNPLVRAHRDECGGCLRDRNAQERAHRPVQGAFLLALDGGGQGTPQGPGGRVPWPAEDPAAPLRVCGCGREHRLRDSVRCPDCVVAAEQERIRLGAVGSR
ncbi:hypothetical protein ABZ543_08365 [Streptomyces roseifaciens]